jgi:hypothetical protein
VTPWGAGLFEYLLENHGKPPNKVCAVGKCHIQVPYSTRLTVFPARSCDSRSAQYSRQNPREQPLADPSSDIIEVTLLLLTWHHLFHWCDPRKDVDDLKELQQLGDWYLNFFKYI